MMKQTWYALVLGAIVGLGCVRIIATYDAFWQTWDEPAHLAAGLQWWEHGRITHERLHPPLARIAMAAGPYFAGLRGIPGAADHWTDGNALLHEGGLYERNLALARFGVLPFFVLASLVVAAWTRCCAGEMPALVATFLFTLLPPVLAHGGLASLDMACAALVAASLYALFRWLEQPGWMNAAVLGVSAGLAITAKFSAIAFLAAGDAAVCLAWFLGRRGAKIGAAVLSLRGALLSLLIAATFCLVSVWAVYRFSFGTILQGGAGGELESVLAGLGPLSPAARSVAQALPLPALDFFWGLFDVVYFRRDEGHLAWFLGSVGKEGWWLFYPVLLAVKTPASFLLLVAAGCVASWQVRGCWPVFAPLLAAVAIVLAGIFFTPHNGLRQILSVYPLLAVVAGAGAAWLWQTARHPLLGRVATITIIASCAASSFAAHPDYLAYFNVLAGSKPEAVAADSDLDWGQDLRRLAMACERRNIDRLNIRYNGSKGISLARFPLPETIDLPPHTRIEGWVAISRQNLLLGTGVPAYDQFAWLSKEQPVEEVGASILLYKIER
jgi:4-amino-4-deoxy-L-arabinose transferase-like glycosyltransferase